MGIQPKDTKASTTLLTTREVADRLRLKPATILDYIRRGELAAVDVATGRRTMPLYRVAESDLAEWIDRRKAGSA